MAEFKPVEGQLKADTLVVGGGIAGITAAIETAEVGKKVILLERLPSLGGRVAALNQYFPIICNPHPAIGNRFPDRAKTKFSGGIVSDHGGRLG